MVLVGLEVHMRAWTDNGLADCSEGMGRPAMRISGKSYLPAAQERFFTVKSDATYCSLSGHTCYREVMIGLQGAQKPFTRSQMLSMLWLHSL